ncbi:hypothetical protein CROQUDRAFT_37060 [Cronartium quercuum f. sp. fusiforme G11]|uniref:DUF1279 domain-containing protein n=1 Tax=Cronartium quercuum f. sp. fusiforme G11 TaxID=708437 RepID=A0A9P6NVM0_9BASI|nr:hypothetical protein CROQUDRAFT_37060 [Cronartium quercuum f. sp. fusiforme G11]
MIINQRFFFYPRLFCSKSSNQTNHEILTGGNFFGKIKQLTKQFGSAALVIYGILSAIDFSLSFVTIYLIGTEHVRQAEDWILEQLHWKRESSNQNELEREPISSRSGSNHEVINSNESVIEEPTISSDGQSLLWTTAIVAYTIHKTVLLPIRVGLTAWITPPIVRTLRKRGWNVGKNLKS